MWHHWLKTAAFPSRDAIFALVPNTLCLSRLSCCPWPGLPPGGLRQDAARSAPLAPLRAAWPVPPTQPSGALPRPNRVLLFLSLLARPSISNSVIKVLFLIFGLVFFPPGEKVVSFMLSYLPRLWGQQQHEGRAVPKHRKTKSPRFRPYAVFLQLGWRLP